VDGEVPAYGLRLLCAYQIDSKRASATSSSASYATRTTNLDLSLLKSSPPEVVELTRSNKRFTESLRECRAVVSPVRRYVERMTQMCETQNATIAIMAKQIADQNELLHKRKKAKKRKRVQLEGISIYTTAEVLRIAREAKAKAKTKRPAC
jgi:hypothetical protein